MRERAQASLLKIVLKSSGVQLSEKNEEADFFHLRGCNGGNSCAVADYGDQLDGQ